MTHRIPSTPTRALALLAVALGVGACSTFSAPPAPPTSVAVVEIGRAHV